MRLAHWIRNVSGAVMMVTAAICTVIFEGRPLQATAEYPVQMIFYGPNRYVGEQEQWLFHLLALTALIYFPMALHIAFSHRLRARGT